MTDIPKKQLFLVDDDKFLLDMYVIKFTNAGYDVKAVDATDAGLKLLRDGFQPDVALIDIKMAGMDGLEMLEAIRREKLMPKAAVIMLTNQGQSDDIVRAQKMGVDGYIVKATTIPSEVLAEVEKICNSKKSS